ncbi:hypothetical protein CZ765_12270 [Corynebacterium casei]|nr:hypothetical protein CZ765_12270 [Corynebacterium casei]
MLPAYSENTISRPHAPHITAGDSRSIAPKLWSVISAWHS